jgi:hypothetical protein
LPLGEERRASSKEATSEKLAIIFEEELMKKLWLVMTCLWCLSCDYTIPLVDPPQLPIDKNLLGVWEQSKEEDEVEQLLVLPLNANEYMISYPHRSSEALFARAWLVDCAGKTLLQIQWIGNSRGDTADDHRVYQVASYSIKSHQLAMGLLNASVIHKDISSSAELMDAIQRNKNNPKLFTGEMIFRRASH